jgi:prevent-host-death family protein
MEGGMVFKTIADDAVWPLQDAKARFSEVVQRALRDRPQHVSVRGQPAVVILSEAAYATLTASKPSIVDHLLEGPAWPDDVVEAINDRSKDAGRDIYL